MRMTSLQQSAFLLLFLVHFRVTIGGPYFGSYTSPISSDEYEKAQFLSMSSVSEYNKMGESNLTFVEYVNGTKSYTVNSYDYWRHPIWVISLKAINSSEPGTPTTLYVSILAENYGGFGVQFPAYGSNFTFIHLEKYVPRA